MPKPIDAILIGAGQRGANDYGPYALHRPDQINFIAVADPVPEHRTRFAEEHNIPLENQFHCWEELLSRPRIARSVLICAQDKMHVTPALNAIQRGYDVFCNHP